MWTWVGFVGFRRNNKVFLQEADVRGSREGTSKSSYKKFSAWAADLQKQLA